MTETVVDTILDARPGVPGEERSRVSMTQDALDLILKLWAIHGPVMFHQSGGCCDGSSPMCFPDGEFRTGASDALLGTFDISAEVLAGAAISPAEDATIDFWMSQEQFGYWRHTHLTLDVVPGRGAGFSLEAPEGKRFLIRSRLLDDE